MLKNLIAAAIIIFAAWLTIDSTLEKLNNTQDISILTPSQHSMRQPSRQNPGQNPHDIQTQKKRNSQTDRHWNNNPNNQVDKNDNFNRNPARINQTNQNP